MTKGSVIRFMLCCALAMIAGNLQRQACKLTDALVVGRFSGPDALTAVGRSPPLSAFQPGRCWGCAWAAGRCFHAVRRRSDRAYEKRICMVLYYDRRAIGPPGRGRPAVYRAPAANATDFLAELFYYRRLLVLPPGLRRRLDGRRAYEELQPKRQPPVQTRTGGFFR